MEQINERFDDKYGNPEGACNNLGRSSLELRGIQILFGFIRSSNISWPEVELWRIL